MTYAPIVVAHRCMLVWKDDWKGHLFFFWKESGGEIFQKKKCDPLATQR
jgi:hypothetical protein